jgi:hypothetical protein
MTNTTSFCIVAMLVIAGCSSPPPEKVFDFASRPLTGTVPVATTATSLKAQMRRAIDRLQPRLAQCTSGTSGELDITLRLVLSIDEAAILDGIDVGYPDARAASCAREVLSTIDLSVIETRESAVWVMHMPFIVAAYSAQQ